MDSGFSGVVAGYKKANMATATIGAGKMRMFPYELWSAKLPALTRQYRTASPFPHIHLENFIEPSLARELADEFPKPNSNAWTQYKHFNENKTGLTKREMFPAAQGKLADELNSPEFLAWLTELTGIENLLADPTLEGGGLHQSGRGGFLNMHADFTMHHHQKNWRRRINLILYLNPDWKPEWGGAIELWDEQMKHCVASVQPLLNHALIFNTTDTSYHGFPEKLACPEDVSRRSLALYYYTEEHDSAYVAKSTNYQARPADSKSKAALIWMDKKAVHLYSRAKEKFGISDDFASKVLGFFSRKK